MSHDVIYFPSEKCFATFGRANCKCKFFCVYRPYTESIAKEMNIDNDLNLHRITKFRADFATGHVHGINIDF